MGWREINTLKCDIFCWICSAFFCQNAPISDRGYRRDNEKLDQRSGARSRRAKPRSAIGGAVVKGKAPINDRGYRQRLGLQTTDGATDNDRGYRQRTGLPTTIGVTETYGFFRIYKSPHFYCIIYISILISPSITKYPKGE